MIETSKKLDEFTFLVSPDDDSGDIQFYASIGENSVQTYITGWSNSWKSICSDIEQYLLTGKANIELDFDTEPTTISLLKEGNNVIVRIEPSGFTKLQPFSGICVENDVLQKLYDGLLYAMTFRYDDIGCGWNWNDCKMVCYNRMKSRMVEEFLRTGHVQRIEDYVVKHVLVIKNNEILHICDETIGYLLPLVEMNIILDKEGNAIASINIEDIKADNLNKVADSLPSDFDLWVLQENNDGLVKPNRIERQGIIKAGQCFDKGHYKVQELGKDPYGFTTDTLWTACANLDFKGIKHFLSINADLTYVVSWTIRSSHVAPVDMHRNYCYKDVPEEKIRKLDFQKSQILRYIIDNKANLSLKEDHLRECVCHYCPACLKLLLEAGTNPNEREITPYWRAIAVKYRSVLSYTRSIKSREGENIYGILDEMESILIAHGAEDVVIWNDEYKGQKEA